MGRKSCWRIDRFLNYGRHHIDRFLGMASQYEMRTVLDIGAGRGTDLLIARSKNPNVQLHAIEVFPEYQLDLQKHGIVVHPLNIERDRFPFSDESIDVAIANQVLEHVKEMFWILHEATRVLRRGGVLIIGVPNLASLHNRLLLMLGKQPTIIQNHSAHVRAYTKHDVLKTLHTCFPGGYVLEKFGGSNFYPFPPVIAKPLAAILPNMAWGIFLMLKKTRHYDGEFLAYPSMFRLETNFYLGKE